ncbi:Sin3 associated polypeptide p18-domain-containing protein [Podospora appendiculata]|uniref:Sin3 associated polypeptide p18-domain-containing protein n=1 Tax=Podospora appendiculata TaxID=314037 RepID=A0AAE0XFA1_9PEZI|nr:Sin3 associated polypeptide p18-domain-containing protein [Podospora appendiculata]
MATIPDLPRNEVAPFLLKVFYRTGAFHRPEEFASADLPVYLPIYAWKSCTLLELTHLIAAATPSVLPSPAIGTRLVFRLVFADTRGRTDQPPRFVAKDLGSVVIGGGGPGTGIDEDGVDIGGGDGADGAKSLNDAKFVVGDYVSCAILPPNELTGEVAAPGAARVGRGVSNARDVRPASPVARREQPGSAWYGDSGRGEGGRARGGEGLVHGYGGRDMRDGGRDGGRYSDRDRGGGRGVGFFPDGEWRRGERVPEHPMGPARGSR